MLSTMSELRTLKLIMTIWDFHEDEGHGNYLVNEKVFTVGSWREFQKADRFRVLLGSIPDLETLALHFSGGNMQLENIMGRNHWRSLSHLSLRAVRSCEAELFKFFKTHAETLRVIYLEMLDLELGYWRSILPRLRNALVLEDFSLEGDCPDKDGSWQFVDFPPSGPFNVLHPSGVKDYMVHDGPWPFPLPPLN